MTDASPTPAPRPVYRLLDANANRAREALRVMEDAARFLFDDAELAARAKQLRHDLATALRRLPFLPAHRDTPNDVGTAITTQAEQNRADAADVVIAAGKRLSESLRCCEEYGKIVDASFAGHIEQVRYRGYELERLLHARLAAEPLRQWRLCVIVSADLCEHHPWLDVARRAVDAGADCVQLREKTLEAAALLERASQLVEAVGGHADVIVNDRPDVAVLSGAMGVHLGQNDLPIATVRSGLGRRLRVGSSTHDLAEAEAAVAAGADYCGVGAMFPTTTKVREASGLRYLQQFVQRFPTMPHLAIGGIGAHNIADVVAAGARGVAVSAAVCRADRPDKVVAQLLEAFEAAEAIR